MYGFRHPRRHGTNVPAEDAISSDNHSDMKRNENKDDVEEAGQNDEAAERNIAGADSTQHADADGDTHMSDVKGDDSDGDGGEDEGSPANGEERFVVFRKCDWCNMNLRIGSDSPITEFTCSECHRMNRLALPRSHPATAKHTDPEFQSLGSIDGVEVRRADVTRRRTARPAKRKARSASADGFTTPDGAEIVKANVVKARTSSPFYAKVDRTNLNEQSMRKTLKDRLEEVKRDFNMKDISSVFHTTGFNVKAFHFRRECAIRNVRDLKAQKLSHESSAKDARVVSCRLVNAIMDKGYTVCTHCRNALKKIAYREKQIDEGKVHPRGKYLKLTEAHRATIRTLHEASNYTYPQIQEYMFEHHHITIPKSTLSSVINADESAVLPTYGKGHAPTHRIYKDDESKKLVRDNLYAYLNQYSTIVMKGGHDFAVHALKHDALIKWICDNFPNCILKRPSRAWMSGELQQMGVSRLYVKYVKTMLSITPEVTKEQCAYANFLCHHFIRIPRRRNVYIDYTRMSPMKFTQSRVLCLPGYRPFRLNPLKNPAFELGIAMCSDGLLGWQPIISKSIKSKHWVDLVQRSMAALVMPDEDNDGKPYAYRVTGEDEWVPIYFFMDNEKGEHQKRTDGGWYQSSREFMDFLHTNGTVITPRMVTEWYTRGKKWDFLPPEERPNFNAKFVFVFQSRYSPFFMPNEEMHYTLSRRVSSVCYNIALERLKQSEDDDAVLVIDNQDMIQAIHTCLSNIRKSEWNKYIDHVTEFSEALSDEKMNVRILPNNLKLILHSVCRLPNEWKEDFDGVQFVRPHGLIEEDAGTLEYDSGDDV